MGKVRRGRLAIGLAVLAAAPPLALFEHLSATRMELQRIADSAAMAGGVALARGEDARAAALARLARTARGRLAAAPVIEAPPAAGRFAGSAGAVRVLIAGEWRPPLAGTLTPSGKRLAVRATVALLPFPNGDMGVERVE